MFLGWLSDKKWFVILSLVKDYGHSMLCNNGVYFFESMFYCVLRDFEFVFKDFHRRYMCGCFGYVVMTMTRFTFHFLLIRFLISGSYFFFIMIVFGKNLLLQCVYSINSTVMSLVGLSGRFD